MFQVRLQSSISFLSLCNSPSTIFTMNLVESPRKTLIQQSLRHEIRNPSFNIIKTNKRVDSCSTLTSQKDHVKQLSYATQRHWYQRRHRASSNIREKGKRSKLLSKPITLILNAKGPKPHRKNYKSHLC